MEDGETLEVFYSRKWKVPEYIMRSTDQLYLFYPCREEDCDSRGEIEHNQHWTILTKDAKAQGTQWAMDPISQTGHAQRVIPCPYTPLENCPNDMVLMRAFRDFRPRNFITLRNQRGYGTQKNWMWVRQELLHYVKGNPDFTVTYTDIPKILRGYYKKVNGLVTENLERSKSKTIRPGNVWVDIQHVFYRMEENVVGCYAQKPLKAIQRIVQSSSKKGDLIVDFFAHSGTTLIAAELSHRRVYTFDIDPIFAEITIRRLEHYRKTGKTGWQWHNPFPEIDQDLQDCRD